MSTIKQIKAIENLVGNGGNVTKAMLDAGYSKETAHTPSKLTQSKGYKELLDKYGLTDELVIGAVVEDIKEGKLGERSSILTLASKMKGFSSDKLDITSGGDKLGVVVLPLRNE